MSKSKVDFDDYTGNYNSLLRESTGFFTKSEAYFAKYKVDILRQLVPADVRRLLEYGCGIGRNVRYLHAAFPDVAIIGSDISVASLEIARKENPDAEFFVEDIDGYAGDPYEAIFVAGVFHHIPVHERLDVMKTLYTRLRPEGTIVIFEHNPFNPITRRIVNDCPYDHDAVLLKPAELKSLLHEAGLHVQRSAYCLFVPPVLSVLLPLEPKLSWLPLGGQYWVKATRPA